jgi:hypothetical protein
MRRIAFVVGACVCAHSLMAQGTRETASPPSSTVLRRSTVLTRPPSAAATVPAASRPASALPQTAAPSIPMRAARPPALVSAASRLDRSTGTGTGETGPSGVGATPTSVRDAATRLARHYYGTQPRDVVVRDDKSVTVFLKDSARLEKAPPGLGVDNGVALPVRFLSLDSASGAMMALKPWFDDGGGLRFDSRRNAYVGTIRMGLRDTLNATRPRQLSPAVRFSIMASADSVTPERIEITETNVFVTSARVSTTRREDAMRVTVWPDFSDRGVDLWIPFRRDTLVVRVDRPRVDGLGLESAMVTVAVPPGALAPEDSVAVMLQATRGSFDAQTVYPKGNTPATAKLRSDGIGALTVTASAPALDAGVASMEFTIPMGLLTGGLIGALMGSGLITLRERRRASTRNLGAVIGSGLLAGMVVAVIIAIGVMKLPGLDLPSGSGSLVALLAGVVGGYIGPKGLEGLIPALKTGQDAPTG